ncbi:MAG: zinc dependent phospholipase C family protein [Bradymonadia bacterium]
MKRAKFYCCLGLYLVVGGIPAHAWKPTTHVHLANEALKGYGLQVEADKPKSNYKVRLRVDDRSMRLRGNQRVLDAIASYPNYFFAGVIGPDGFPDLVTGQTVAHPDVALPGKSGIGGTDRWLTRLWKLAHMGRKDKKSQMFLAFTAGYITHAIGDLFAHAMVNSYTGGPFDINVEGNMLRHMTLEGYIGLRTPELAHPNFKPKAKAITDHLFKAFVSLSPSAAKDLFRTNKPGVAPGSFIKHFWMVRHKLKDLRKKLRLAGKNAKKLNKLPKVLINMFPRSVLDTYLAKWIAQIDTGFKAWIVLNQKVMHASVYSHPGSKAPSTNDIKKAIAEFQDDELRGMLGDPTRIRGLPTSILHRLTKKMKAKLRADAMQVLSKVVPKRVLAFAQKVMKDPFAGLCRTATKVCSKIENVHTHVKLKTSTVKFGTSYGKTDCKLNMKAVDSNLLKLRKGAKHFDWTQFAAASNTVTMTQLMLLERHDALKLLEKIGLKHDEGDRKKFLNMMLGFLQSIDDPSKRSTKLEHAKLLNESAYFLKVFKAQEGYGDDGKIFGKLRACTATATKSPEQGQKRSGTSATRRQKDSRRSRSNRPKRRR